MSVFNEKEKLENPLKSPYLKKMIKDCTEKKTTTNAEEKLNYIKSLTFNSNHFKLKKTFNNEFYIFKNDFENIIFSENNLFIHLSIVDNPIVEKTKNNDKSDENNYMVKLNKALIEELDNVFEDERIILKSSRIYSLKDMSKSYRFYLIHASASHQESHIDKQKKNLSFISLNKEELNKNFTLNEIYTELQIMNMYRSIYYELLKKDQSSKIQNFVETNRKKNKTSHLGFFKTSIKYNKGNLNGEIFTIHVPEINKIFGTNEYNFHIKTLKYFIPQGKVKITNMQLLNNELVKISIIPEVIKFNNFKDKDSITFSQADFNQSKFNLYCEILSLLEKNPYIENCKSKLEETFTIKENINFYRDNIIKPIKIGFIYEENLTKEAEITFNLLKLELEDKINANNKIIPSIVDKSMVIFNEIKIKENQDIMSTLETLDKSGCDGFICFNDIADYYNRSDDKYTLIQTNIVDYYSEIKKEAIKRIQQNGKNIFVTQGIQPNKLRNIYKLKKDDLDEVLIEGDKEKKADLKNKIKVTFQELLTKIIFYSGKVKMKSSLEEGTYGLISFKASSKLLSFIKIQTKDDLISILEKDIRDIKETERATQMRKNENIINFLASKLKQNNYYIKREILSEIKEYDQFIIYDFNHQNFMICTDEETYLLSDEDYEYRKHLLSKKINVVKKTNEQNLKESINEAKKIRDDINKASPSSYLSQLNIVNLNDLISFKEHLEQNQKENDIFIKKLDTSIKKYRENNTYKDSFMAPSIPLYNISENFLEQIFLFNINNNYFYFTAQDRKKTQTHKHSRLLKIYFNENNSELKKFYFSATNNNLVRNGLNAKSTIWEKISRMLIEN